MCVGYKEKIPKIINMEHWLNSQFLSKKNQIKLNSKITLKNLQLSLKLDF